MPRILTELRNEIKLYFAEKSASTLSKEVSIEKHDDIIKITP